MSETKYKSISSTIENSIKNNVYREKLPPVRTLAVEFEVSTRTINKALKDLVTKGLIIPNGPKGILICSKSVIRPKTNIVSIFCNTSSPDPNDDPMLKELKLKIEADGYKPIFMNAPDPTAFDDENFWSSNWVDGYIFVYSTINKELAYRLHNSGVPFVVANRLPPECGAHWVEFNLKKTLSTMVKTLLESGRKRIFFAYSRMSLPSYVEYVKQIWNEVISEYSKECSGYSWYFNGESHAKNDLECAQKFLELNFDALITTGLSPFNIEKELARKGMYPNEDYSLFYRSHRVEVSADEFHYAITAYKALADETWNLFKKIVETPEIKAQNILVDEDIHINRNLIRRDSFNTKQRNHQEKYVVA